MLALAWGWIVNWIIGWGGLGALISAGLWLLWFFCPAFLLTYKSQLLHAAIIATTITASATYFFTQGYNAGESECGARWDAANIKAAKDAKARDDAIAFLAKSEMQKANDDLQAQADDLQKKVEEYEKETKTRVGGNCPITQPDIDRLRSIR